MTVWPIHIFFLNLYVCVCVCVCGMVCVCLCLVCVCVLYVASFSVVGSNTLPIRCGSVKNRHMNDISVTEWTFLTEMRDVYKVMKGRREIENR
jgi:hypothetical protein